jgi:hypothetical protein
MIINWFKSLFRKKPVTVITKIEESHQRVNSSPPVMGKTTLTVGEPYQMHLIALETLSHPKPDNAKVVPIPDSPARARKREESYRGTSPAIPLINDHPTAAVVTLFPNLQSDYSPISASTTDCGSSSSDSSSPCSID